MAVTKRTASSRVNYPGWLSAGMVPAILCLVPIIAVFWFAMGDAPEWSHILDNLLHAYFYNTFHLLVGTILMVSLLGISCAALVSLVDFPGKRFFEWGLILPLSIPAYLMAFSYAEICGYEGWLSKLTGLQIDLLNRNGAVFIFGMALFPYVYLPLRSHFKASGEKLIEVGASLGRSRTRSFFALLLPVAMPVIAGGLFLSSMEVLNDFGVVKYCGVPTFTVGIFRAWTGVGDLSSALRLASILLLTVFSFSLINRWKKSSSISGEKHPTKKAKSPIWLQIMALTTCSLILFLSFVLPVAQMLSGVWQTAGRVMNEEFFTALINSLKLAGISALLVVIFALLINFSYRVSKGYWLAKGSIMSSVLGYSVPGAVMALGVLAFITRIDKWLYSMTESTDWFISTTLIALIFALVVRYMAVGVKNIQSGYLGISNNTHDAARSLGRKNFNILFSVDVPLLKNYLLSVFILVFVDVLKELPLTMILRPFNFDTLATKAFYLASDELLRESANASILIVLAGLLPIFVLNRLMKNAGA